MQTEKEDSTLLETWIRGFIEHRQAKQKMHCGLRRNHNISQKVANGEKDSLSTKLLGKNNIGASLEDCEVSSLDRRNFDHRCAFITFLTIDPDGHGRIVAVPLQCSDHSNHLGSRAQVNMDGLHLVSRRPSSSLKVDRQKVQRVTPSDMTCPVKSFTAKSFSGSNVQRHSRNKAVANKCTKFNDFPQNSSALNFLSCSHFSGLVLSDSNATSSSNILTNDFKVDKAIKRNSRKKGRKKGKQNKKLSCETGSTELDFFSEECVEGSSPSETYADDHGNGPVSSATSQVVSLSDCGGNKDDFEGDSNGTVNFSAMLKARTSSIDELELSEATLTSVDQKFTGEYSLFYSRAGAYIIDPCYSIFDRVEDTQSKRTICDDNMYTKAFSGIPNSHVVDSVSVARNTDDSSIVDYDVRSETNGYIVRKGYCSRRNSLNVIVDSCSNAEGTMFRSQACSSNAMHLVVLDKRDKQVKVVRKNSSVCRRGSVGNSHGRTGKENNHSVWQKVQRNNADEINCETKNVNSAFLYLDVTLKEAPSLETNCDIVESDMSSKDEDKNHFKKVCRKLKKKVYPGSKQEYNCYSRKGSHATKASSYVRTNISVQQNERLDISDQVNDKKRLGSASRSLAQIGCQRVGFHNSVLPDGLEPLEIVCNTVSMTDQITEIQNNSLSKPCDSSNMLEVQSSAYPAPIAEVEKETFVAEHSKQDHSFGSIQQKWVPVGKKNPGLKSSCGPNSSPLAHSEESGAEMLISKSIVEEELASSFHIPFSSMNAEVVCIGQNSGKGNCSSIENESQIQKLRDQNPRKSKEQNATARHLTCDLEDINMSVTEIDSNKISQAVNDAFRVQLACEAVQIATGGPIAEFERLLHSASPVICQLKNVMSCQICPRDQVIGGSLCSHEMPNLSLGSLWKWYEKHGSYGLEVRAEDYENSKRIGVDRFTFRAYFVPFLSAVQLFRSRKYNPMDNGGGILRHVVSERCKMDGTLGNSNVGRTPIFSILVPEPCTNNTNLLSLVSEVDSSGLISLSAIDGISVQSSDTAKFDDLELLFEYFELEQPQQRRPLFEKIKELIRSEPSQCKAYGDPTALASIDLHDLHPRSWYSVAWYPIYRIPDGNFRAAFLTYHSLGHLVCRSSMFDSPNADACIVSPVVGLQSYNTQGECWFHPRQSEWIETAETARLNASGILKERLRTLEQTAMLMARAAVNKGNFESVNRHPDFEFFLSRRWRR